MSLEKNDFQSQNDLSLGTVSERIIFQSWEFREYTLFFSERSNV